MENYLFDKREIELYFLGANLFFRKLPNRVSFEQLSFFERVTKLCLYFKNID